MLRAQRLPAVVLQDGALRLVEKDYAGARADGEEVLKGSPEDLTAAVLSYVAERHVDKAIERLRQLAATRPGSAPLHLLLGEWLAQQKQTAEARKSFEAAKSADPASRAADLGLARLDIEENRAGPAPAARVHRRRGPQERARAINARPTR